MWQKNRMEKNIDLIYVFYEIRGYFEKQSKFILIA